MPNNRNRIRHGAGNMVLLLASLLISYAVIGSLLLVYGPAVAWKPINKFPTAATVPWQASGPKRDSDPYIAIIGDSYAVGIGDWNFNRPSRHDPFYSGDVISERLAVPVLSFGKNGASSVEAMVTNPGRIMNADSCFLLQSPPRPQSLVVYVYEGNDFNDNLLDLQDAGKTKANKRDIQAFIADESRSARDVPCYVQVSKLAINLIGGYWKILFSNPEISTATSGQAVKFGDKTEYLGTGLQGPALELDEQALTTSFEMLGQSLDHLMARFSGIPVLVVDVPSVLTPYRLLAKTVSTKTYHGGKAVQETRLVRERSNTLCSRLRALVLSKGASFLDARPMLERAAAKAPIHGPRDWKHLNRTGQTILGKAVAEALKRAAHDSGCSTLRSVAASQE